MRIIIFSWHFLGVYSALWGLAAGAFPSSVQIGELEDGFCFFVVLFCCFVVFYARTLTPDTLHCILVALSGPRGRCRLAHRDSPEHTQISEKL